MQNSGKNITTANLGSVNPWDLDSRQVTGVRNCLILAEQMGFQTLVDESRCARLLAELPSSQFIELRREIAAKNKSLLRTKQDITNHVLERETADFTHLDVVEKRINMVKQLCTDLDSIMKNADLLIHRLQKPFVGDHIKMDSSYHRFACDVFSQLIPTLNDLSSNLDNITWAANNKMTAAQLDSLLVEVQSLTASVQTSYNTLNQMRQGVETLSLSSQSPIKLDVSRTSGI